MEVNTTVQQVLSEELSAMLYVYGDEKNPLKETVVMAENILVKVMVKIFEDVIKCARLRSATQVSIEDFAFILRKNKPKLIRFIKHMKYKETTAKISKKVDSELADSKVDAGISKNRSKSLQDFLTTLDLYDVQHALANNEPDVLRLKRLMNSDKRTRFMPPDEYIEYVKSKEISLVNTSRLQKFKLFMNQNGIISDPTILSKFGWESMVFMAQEEVAELVEAALLIKNETKTNPFSSEFPVIARNKPLHAPRTSWDTGAPAYSNPTAAIKTENPENLPNLFLDQKDDTEIAAKKKKLDSKIQKTYLLYDLSLKPTHLIEATRRKNYINTIPNIISKTTGFMPA